MSEVTRVVSALDAGEPRKAQQLLPLVYDELRKLAAARMAAEAPGQTLEARKWCQSIFQPAVRGWLALESSRGPATFGPRGYDADSLTLTLVSRFQPPPASSTAYCGVLHLSFSIFHLADQANGKRKMENLKAEGGRALRRFQAQATHPRSATVQWCRDPLTTATRRFLVRCRALAQWSPYWFIPVRLSAPWLCLLRRIAAKWFARWFAWLPCQSSRPWP